jgi:pimeloyl-ACP methyl ester carboxylesterase
VTAPTAPAPTSTGPTISDSGLAPVNGLQLYWESSGSGGTPLILLHGGFGLTSMFGELTARLAAGRRVIAVDLQGHGRTADIDRPLSFEALGDDIAALIGQLGLGQVDLMGYSLGGSTALRTALQNPDLVRRLVLVATPCSRSGWYPDMQAQMLQIGRAGFDMMRQTPLYSAYAAVAPNPDGFPDLMDKMGALMSRPYDWREEVAALQPPTLLAFADADSIPVTHIAEFFALLGGGLRDGSWDDSGRPKGQLAILPGTTHYTIFASPALAEYAVAFLDG